MKFSERLLLLFGPPNSIDDEAFAREYERLLKSYQPDIIDAAVDQLARTHKYPGWPKVADCVAAAEDALEARAWKERAKNGGERVENNAVAAARLMARRFVNGIGANGWEWAPEFRDHPWVVLAETEGWGRELRSSCLYGAFRRYADPYRKPNDLPTVENVMPDAETVAYWRKEAERTREAIEWREANKDHRSIKDAKPINVTALLNANRAAFLAKQADSPNHRLHRRITGDRD